MHPGSPVSAPLLEVEGLSAGYGGAPALEGVAFDLKRGERIGVLGPNGGGKTTLFRVLLGELPPLAGRIRGPARMGVVPQTERSRLDFPVSALDVALMGTLSTLPWWRRPRRV
jgi:ABC-type Mn2+/Zn2+ transport system ATPase subunit